MTIDTINISTFGLKVLTQEGYFDLPARKKILIEQGNAERDIRFAGKDCTVTLLGRYANVSALVSNLNALETLIKLDLKHAIVLIGHGLNFTGVFNQGFEVTSYNGGRIAKVTMQINISE